MVLEQWLPGGVLGNPAYLIEQAIVIFVVIVLILFFFKRYGLHLLRKAAKKTENKYDDALIGALRKVAWPFYVIIAAYFASRHLMVAVIVDRIFSIILVLGIVYYSVRAIQGFIEAGFEQYAAKTGKADASLPRILSKIIIVVVWAIAFLFILTNFGVEIGPLIAGLGVGGIAIAFALQNVLQDIFASFTIYFDKPFETGDFIVIGNDKGTVQYIGLKSTRLKTLQGEELIVSNRELTDARVNNFKKMEKRRVVFEFGVEYGTPPVKLQKINKIIKKIVTDEKNTDFDRSHFKSFGDSSLVFEVVYYLLSKEYADYMDAQQNINLEITKAFKKEKISMAFPSRTIYMRKG